jgi:hypothetical protein
MVSLFSQEKEQQEHRQLKAQEIHEERRCQHCAEPHLGKFSAYRSPFSG